MATTATRQRREAAQTSAIGGPPIVVGHRGASGYRPEHTLASYELAARLGADSLEPDLVSTSDNVLICAHDLEMSATTDVAQRPEFAARRTTRVVAGQQETGWFFSDFSLEEIKTLWVRERYADLRQSNTIYERRCRITTFEELLQLRARLSDELGRTVGLSVELKDPAHHRAIGLPLEEPMLAAMRAVGVDRAGGPVFVMTFEPTALIRLRADLGMQAPSVLLAATGEVPVDLRGGADEPTYDELLTPASLRRLATWITAVGPEKDMVIPRRGDGSLGGPTDLVRHAHEAGLRVHVWTFRAENAFLPMNFRSSDRAGDYGDVLGEMTTFVRAGIDALISDHADLAVLARAEVFA